MFESIKRENKLSSFYNLVFIVRRLVISIFFVFLDYFTVAQLSIVLFSSFSVILYMNLVRPYKDSFLNNLEIGNEICILTLSYLMLSFSDLQPDLDLRY